MTTLPTSSQWNLNRRVCNPWFENGNKSNEIKRRTAKNQDLYKSIYEEAEYSNVEGISIIEKNEISQKICLMLQASRSDLTGKQEAGSNSRTLYFFCHLLVNWLFYQKSFTTYS